MVHRVRLLFASAILAAGLTVGIQHVEAQTQDKTLDLLGVRWEKPTVAVQIKAAGGVTSHAIADVEQAIADWNLVLDDIKLRGGAAPHLALVSGVKKPDIIIQMKIGGGATLGSTGSRTSSPFACVLNSASIQLSGKAFGEAISSTGTQNIARHEIGHALGLGHSDDPDDLMHPIFESSEFLGGTTIWISQCDRNGLEAIYLLPTVCGAISDSVSCQSQP